MDDPAAAPFDFEVSTVSNTPEAPSQTEHVAPAAPSKRTGRKSIMALSVFALGLNATAAVYTMSPSDFALPKLSIPLPDISTLAELLPQRAPAPIPEAVVTALQEIQSAQQQQASELQKNSSLLQLHTALLQQNAAQRQQDSDTFDALRHGLTDEQVGVKKVSGQLSTLIAKVDSLQNTIATEITSSIPKGRARSRLYSAAHKRMARQANKPVGPVSVGGAPLTIAPAQTSSPEG